MKKIMFIGLEFNTFGKPTGLSRKINLPVTPSGQTMLLVEQPCEYTPFKTDDEDITARISMIKDIITITSQNNNVKEAISNGVQIVFMTPEFLFRGCTGAYTLDNYQKVVEGLTKVATDYKGWLFVFGSLLGKWEVDSTNGKSKTLIHNSVLVVTGGEGVDSNRIITKEFKSGIDFMGKMNQGNYGVFSSYVSDSGALTHYDVEHPSSGPTGTGKEEQKKPYDGNGIFTVNGITYGVEICLDHLEGRLTKSPVGKGSNLVQVQLIPSAGAWIEDKAIVTCGNGLVFNCDSQPASPSCTVKRVVKTYTPYTNQPATFDFDDCCYTNILLDKTSHQILQWGKAARLKIYNPLDLPNSVTMN